MGKSFGTDGFRGEANVEPAVNEIANEDDLCILIL